MRRDPTRIVLLYFTAFYGIVSAGRWYFYFRPAYFPTEFRLSWVGIGGNAMGLAICTFLLFDANRVLARAFWFIKAVSSLLSLAFRSGLFWSFPRHGDLTAAVHFTTLFFVSSAFLLLHSVTTFSIFGSSTTRLLRKWSAEHAVAPYR